MNLTYKTTSNLSSLRRIHVLTIEEEVITTTKQKEILLFARPRIQDKFVWKQLKEAVRLGQSLTVAGGK